MKRNVFRTKNQLFLNRYVFIILMMIVLTVLFLVVANLGAIAVHLNLVIASTEENALDSFASSSKQDREAVNDLVQAASVTGDDTPMVAIYDPENDNTMILTQLQITKQPYEKVSSLSDLSEDVQLLIIDADSLSSSKVATLQKLIGNGLSVLFTGLPDSTSLRNQNLQNLLGIASIAGETTWKGIRTSSDLLTGTMVEKPNYEVSGWEVTLAENNKIYACALPEKYWLYENEDLPPIIWRHIDGEGSGRVYVFNGDFIESEMGYGIIPVVLSEINENYLYPVINAYCVTVSGYPFSENEERESWQRLYSRDKLLIQQDMLSTQLKRYSSVYKVRLTCFSNDYDLFSTTTDSSLSYYTDQIASSRGLLAKESNGTFSLGDNVQGTKIVDWDKDFQFWDASTGTISLPICFHSTVDNVAAEEYKIAGFASTMGYFALNIDYENLLDYDGEDDIWTLYCKDQETMLGTQKRDYGWLERVTVKEAFGRVLKLLEMKVGISYSEDHIEVNVDNFEDKAWFILRSSCEELKITNGTIEEIGDGCYFITLTAADAVITWKED